MSVQLDRLVKNDERFYDWYWEDDGYGDTDAECGRPSVWLHCSPGWVCPSRECGTIHTKTVGAALRLARTVIRKKDWSVRKARSTA